MERRHLLPGIRIALPSAMAATLILAGCSKPVGPPVRVNEPATNGKIKSAAPAGADKGVNPPIPTKITSEPGLHNVLRISPQIYSGSEPHGEEGLKSLTKLGIKTIVSVDGARPNVELAGNYGMKYVHIPIGYEGIPELTGRCLARAVRECRGPIYFHCHHGKHRGPAAAAVACIAADGRTTEAASAILEIAGTGKEYTGLWRDVKNYRPPERGSQCPELHEVAEVESFAAAMATIDRSFDNLKFCRDAGWSAPKDHSDLVAEQEAIILEEGLREANRNLSAGRNAEFIAWLVEVQQSVGELRDRLRRGEVSRATAEFKCVEAGCKKCHTKYRN